MFGTRVRIPATGVRFYFHAPRNGGKISSTPAATSTAPSDNTADQAQLLQLSHTSNIYNYIYHAHHFINNATRKLTKIIKKYKNDCFQKYLVNLSPSADSNYSLWKASRKLTRPPPIRCPQDGWARSPIEKANLFVNYLPNAFKPHASNATPKITEYLHSPFQMSPPLNLSLLQRLQN